MRITQNYALAIRPHYTWFAEKGPGNSSIQHSWYTRNKLHEIDLNGVRGSFLSERDAWEFVVASGPKFFDLLRADGGVYTQGLLLRGETMMGMPKGEFEDLEARFNAEMFNIHKVMMGALDASPRNKLKANRLSTTRGVSLWEVRASVNCARLGPKPSRIHVLMLPSPIEDQTWSVHVRMPALSADMLHRNQVDIKNGLRQLTDLGYTIDDVTQGSWMDA